MGHLEDLVRDFNRTHTKKWKLLQSRYLDSSYSLTEARALFEIATAPEMTPTALADVLELDRGYISRLLASFKKRGLVVFRACERDGRSRFVSLTKKGMHAFDDLQARANNQARQFIQSIPEERRAGVLDAFRRLRDEMDVSPMSHRTPAGVTLRNFRAGDLGLILAHHGALYSKELGWGLEFEGYVAETLAEFARHHDPENERVWIAERYGQFLGSVALVKVDKNTAQLRWLIVAPEARGLGIGKLLTEEVLRFARSRHYQNLILWTEQTREAARAIYRKYEFRLTESKHSKSWGTPVVEEKWELTLERHHQDCQH